MMEAMKIDGKGQVIRGDPRTLESSDLTMEGGCGVPHYRLVRTYIPIENNGEYE